MADRPLVSVVVPFLDAEEFIAEAVESVFDQSYERWELFLVDDGSVDGSSELARGYAAQTGSVSYLEHPDHANLGKSASRNLAIRKASGKYIAFLDADDAWFPNILEEQVAILESHPEVAMVYGPIHWWYSWTGQPEDDRDYVEELGVEPETVIEPPVLLTLFLQDRAAVPSDILVRRGIVDRVGGFEEQFKVMYEDQVFYAKVCVTAPVYASGRCWYHYRQHPNSSCAKGMMSGEYFAARPAFLEWLRHYLIDHEVDDARLWQALQEELWPYRHPLAHRLLRRIPGANDLAMRAAERTRSARPEQPPISRRPGDAGAS